MTDPIDAIAAKLIDAAYDVYGRPPEKGGIYVAKVLQQQDVPAYFRQKAALAREPRSRELWERLQKMSLDDEGAAEFVMHGGLQSLAHDAKLPADQRRVIEEVKKLRQWQDEVRSEVENELHPKQTPDWVGQGRATGPIDAVAEKLVEAAYELFGRPPEAGGEYIHTVIRETDVPGYFRKMLQIAEGARSRDLWQYFEKVRNHDAEMVMNAGLEYLSRQATLPADERHLVEEIKKFQSGISLSSTKSRTSGTSSEGGQLLSTNTPSSCKHVVAPLS